MSKKQFTLLPHTSKDFTIIGLGAYAEELGVLKFLVRDNESSSVYSIDIFFNLLSEVHQNNAVGIVLSSNENDGLLGLKAKKNESITSAQDPVSAALTQMPQSAGLTICRKVVQNHEGLIEVFGRPNIGATFNVFIPERD